MKRLLGGLVVSLLVISMLLPVAAQERSSPPYVYKFPKTPAYWGKAVSFTNLSPGFFQVMFQNNAGIVRIATYGIVGASMDKLRDPQLMMVFAFDKQVTANEYFGEEEFISSHE